MIFGCMDLDEITLIQGKGFVRKSDKVAVNIADGNRLVTYGPIDGNFEEIVKKDIEKRLEVPEGVNGFFIHGEIPLGDRTSENPQVQIDYYAFVYVPR